MKSYVTSLESFQKRLVQYISYLNPQPEDLVILQVSYQFLSESQGNQLAEVVGLIQEQELT